VIVKICGFRDPANAADVVRAGADWLGINFWPRSKRFVDVELGAQIATAARAAGAVTLVGVFVNQDPDHVAAVIERVGLDLVQLHGEESPGECARFGRKLVKAFSVRSAADAARFADYDCDYVLADAPSEHYGGTGELGDWTLARTVRESGRNLLLAGGLDPDNVADAIASVAPFGVDVASGVEASPGIKDLAKVERFVGAAKAASPGVTEPS